MPMFKQYQQKFRKEWLKDQAYNDWITSSEVDENMAHCVVNIDIRSTDYLKQLENFNSLQQDTSQHVTQSRLEKQLKTRHGSYYFILLENLVQHHRCPCLLDVKLGPRQHGDCASPKKVKIQEAKCLGSTSSSLGVRLCGMKIYRPEHHDFINIGKFEGRQMTDESLRSALYQFLCIGSHLRTDILPCIVFQLKRLRSVIAKLPAYRFFGSSLLIVYEGNELTHGMHGECTKADNALNSFHCSKFTQSTVKKLPDKHSGCVKSIGENPKNKRINFPNASCNTHHECMTNALLTSSKELESGSTYNTSVTSFDAKISDIAFQNTINKECSVHSLHKTSPTYLDKTKQVTFQSKNYYDVSTRVSPVDNILDFAANKKCTLLSVDSKNVKQNTALTTTPLVGNHKCICDCKVDVRLMDFAQASFSYCQNDKIYTGADNGCLFGIDNLTEIFTSFYHS